MWEWITQGEIMVSQKLLRKVEIVREIRALDNIKGSIGFNLIQQLHDIGKMFKKHQILCERFCNELNFNPELIDKQENKIKEELNKLNRFLDNKLIIKFQRDPRGLTCDLSLKTEQFEKQIYEMLR